MRASVELFAAEGYAQTSVQQIVDAAGVTKGALYHYFSSKDDLLFDIYDRMLAHQRSHLEEIVARGLSGIETLRFACIDVIVTSIDWMQEGRVFFASLPALSADRRGEVTRRRRDYNDIFETILSRAQAEGKVRTDVPSAVLIAHFFSDPHYLGQWYSPDGPLSKDELASQLTELYLAGVRPEALPRRRAPDQKRRMPRR